MRLLLPTLSMRLPVWDPSAEPYDASLVRFLLRLRPPLLPLILFFFFLNVLSVPSEPAVLSVRPEAADIIDRALSMRWRPRPGSIDRECWPLPYAPPSWPWSWSWPLSWSWLWPKPVPWDWASSWSCGRAVV